MKCLLIKKREREKIQFGCISTLSLCDRKELMTKSATCEGAIQYGNRLPYRSLQTSKKNNSFLVLMIFVFVAWLHKRELSLPLKTTKYPHFSLRPVVTSLFITCGKW